MTAPSKTLTLGLLALACRCSADSAPIKTRGQLSKPNDDGSVRRVQLDGGQLELSYRGGPVMHGEVPIYYIYYGNWTTRQKNIFTTFTNDLGRSPWLNSVTSVGDAQGPATADIRYAGRTTDASYSQGKVLSGQNMVDVVAAKLAAGVFPPSSQAIYAVMGDVDVTGYDPWYEFCSGWCSTRFDTDYVHRSTGTVYNLHIIFVGNPEVQCPLRCMMNFGLTINGDAGVDAMLASTAQAVSGVLTDPEFSGWSDDNYNAGSLKCQWQYGNTYFTDSGAKANLALNGRDYFLQRHWIHDAVAGGRCALGLPLPSPTATATRTRTRGSSASRTVSPSRTPSRTATTSPSPPVPAPQAVLALTQSGVRQSLPLMTVALSDPILSSGPCADGSGLLSKPFATMLLSVTLPESFPLGGTLSIDTCDEVTGYFDSLLFVGTGLPIASDFGCVAANDDFDYDSCLMASRTVLPAVASRQLYVLVQAANTAWATTPNDFVLSAQYTLPSSSPTASLAPGALPSATASASSTGTVAPTPAETPSNAATPSPVATASRTALPACPAGDVGCAVSQCRRLGLPIVGVSSAVRNVRGTLGPFTHNGSTFPIPMLFGDSCRTGSYANSGPTRPKHVLVVNLGSSVQMGGNLTLDTCGATFNTVMFTGSTCPYSAEDFDCLVGNDDTALCPGDIAVGASANVIIGLKSPIVFVVVAGYKGATGDYSLRWDYKAPAPPATKSKTPRPSSTKTASRTASRKRKLRA